MNSIPEIRLVFSLTKNDSLDFDRNAVTQHLCITPSETTPPTMSKGKLYCDAADFYETQKKLTGLTILPASAPPYQLLKHAYWCIESPKTAHWTIDEPLQQFKQLLLRKEATIRYICNHYNLSADLIIRIFAKSNNMPEMIISSENLSFWAAIGVSISFDFYLD